MVVILTPGTPVIRMPLTAIRRMPIRTRSTCMTIMTMCMIIRTISTIIARMIMTMARTIMLIHDHAAGEVCDTVVIRTRPTRRCCRATASTGARPGRRWRRSVSAPAPAALIVLSFALLNGLWLGGLLSVLAMSLGTAITVSPWRRCGDRKNWAVYFAGDGRMATASIRSSRSAALLSSSFRTVAALGEPGDGR